MTTISAEPTRRDFLYIATGAVGAVGAAATLIPLVSQMNPDASTIAAGAPIEVDLAPIADGQVIKVFWRGKPIFISHRTKKEIEEAREEARRQISFYASTRTYKPVLDAHGWGDVCLRLHVLLLRVQRRLKVWKH